MIHTKATSIAATAKLLEKTALENCLYSVSAAETRSVPPELESREDTQADYSEDLQTLATNIVKLMDIAAHSRSIHEAERAQRDVEIIQSGHKKMMLACYKAANERIKKLEREIKAMEVTE